MIATPTQHAFNPVDYGFVWTDDWYLFDHKYAHSCALKARNIAVKALRKSGYKVTNFTLRGQKITKGGIGSGHPEITLIVNVYGYNIHR